MYSHKLRQNHVSTTTKLCTNFVSTFQMSQVGSRLDQKYQYIVPVIERILPVAIPHLHARFSKSFMVNEPDHRLGIGVHIQPVRALPV